MKSDNIGTWLIRFIKGIFIGAGFILPGTSGGTFAVIFGTFEPMVKFFANMKENVRENINFFLPIVISSCLGIFLFSMLLNHFFYIAEVPLIWFFIGMILGSIPALWRQAGKRGRKKRDVVVFVGSLFLAVAFLMWIYHAVEGSFPRNVYTWLMAGGIIGVGTFIPGFSSANILLVLGIYCSKLYGIANFDLTVLIPLIIGATVAVIALSKLVLFALKKARNTFFHAVVGLVVASTILIVPLDYDYLSINGLLCLGAVIIGLFMAKVLSKLENMKN